MQLNYSSATSVKKELKSRSPNIPKLKSAALLVRTANLKPMPLLLSNAYNPSRAHELTPATTFPKKEYFLRWIRPPVFVKCDEYRAVNADMLKIQTSATSRQSCPQGSSTFPKTDYRNSPEVLKSHRDSVGTTEMSRNAPTHATSHPLPLNISNRASWQQTPLLTSKQLSSDNRFDPGSRKCLIRHRDLPSLTRHFRTLKMMRVTSQQGSATTQFITKHCRKESEPIPRSERELGEINKQLRNKFFCRDTNRGAFRASQGSWAYDAIVSGNAFNMQHAQSSGMECEPTLQIGLSTSKAECNMRSSNRRNFPVGSAADSADLPTRSKQA
uniref:Uncharacterized protein n=1 Tax=Ananas comosus var. bracteatus TaxID=296719 RepID=A0A6V7PPH9_ANACO|nr:unnamed protein product [Ananas comosus var. bracteatus]